MSEPFIGEIRMIGFQFAPRNWAFCDGQILPIRQNEALFALIGNIYGGDGMNNFALPDLRGRVPMHSGKGTGLLLRELGEELGMEAVGLDISTLPTHQHVVQTAAPEASIAVANDFVTVAAPKATVQVQNDFVTVDAPTVNVTVEENFVTAGLNATTDSARESAASSNRIMASSRIYSSDNATSNAQLGGVAVNTDSSKLKVTNNAPNVTVKPAALTVTNSKPSVTVDPAYIGVSVGKPPAVTLDAGGNQVHGNIQPSLVVNFIIALEGIFPPRS